MESISLQNTHPLSMPSSGLEAKEEAMLEMRQVAINVVTQLYLNNRYRGEYTLEEAINEMVRDMVRFEKNRVRVKRDFIWLACQNLLIYTTIDLKVIETYARLSGYSMDGLDREARRASGLNLHQPEMQELTQTVARAQYPNMSEKDLETLSNLYAIQMTQFQESGQVPSEQFINTICGRLAKLEETVIKTKDINLFAFCFGYIIAWKIGEPRREISLIGRLPANT